MEERADRNNQTGSVVSSLSALIDNMPIGLYRTTPAGRILFANRALLNMIGYPSLEELQERNLEQDAEAGYRREDFKRRIERDGEILGLESEWRRRDGELIYVRENARCIRDGDGFPLCYEGTVEDITDRTLAERARDESERRYQALVEKAPDPIVVHADGRLMYVNEAFGRLVGESPSALAGRALMDFVHADSRPFVEARLRALRTGKPVAAGRIRCVGRSGRTAMIEVTSIPTTWKGQPAVQAIARDITEQLKVEETMRHHDRLASLGTLVAGVAHEVNNPLTYMRGNVELGQLAVDEALADEALPLPLRERLLEVQAGHAAVLKGIGQIETITRSLKQVAKPSENDREPHDLDSLVRDHLEVGRVRIKCATVELDLRAPVPIQMNRSELGQVLLNLLLNAADAVEARPDGIIRVRTWQDATSVNLEVADNGPGIPSAVRDQLFTPFFTTKPHGTGLGLSVSMAIVRSHGGELSLRGEEGCGAAFRVRLPCAKVGASPKC